MDDRPSIGFRPYLDGFYDASLQLQMHVYRRSEALFDRWRAHNDTLEMLEDVACRQQEISRRALSAIGGLPETQAPLDVEYVGRVPGDGFDVEKLVYQSLPRVYVTANLYVPRDVSGPTGAVLFVCGHAELAKSYPEYQAVCARLARSGLVALAIDPIGQGERKSYLDDRGNELVRWGTREHTYAGVQCWWTGQSIARYFVHDARRAIDVLCSRPEVDPARIGITGNSGGGTQATWLMMLEPRLAAAAPGTFIMARRDYMWSGQAQDAEQIVPGGTLHGIDHEEFLIAMAPRPVLVLAVDYDFFPLEAAVATVERAKQIYRLLGHEDRISLAHTPGTHAFHPDLAKAATRFFVRYLGAPAEGPADDAEPAVSEPELLNCTERGQVMLDRPDTRRVFDLNLVEQGLAESTGQGRDGRGQAARSWLAERVFAHRVPAGFFPRMLPGPGLSGADAGVSVRHLFWWAEPDVWTAAVLLAPTRGDHAALEIALFDRGSHALDEPRWREWAFARAKDGTAVLTLDVRGTGALEPRALNPSGIDDHYGTMYKLLCDLLWLDDSLEAGRVYDVLRAVEFATTSREIALEGRPIRMFGAGRGALRCYLAAALEPKVSRVELATPLIDARAIVKTRFYGEGLEWQSLIPGMASRCDLTDLRRLFEGRELVLAGPSGRATPHRTPLPR